MLIFDPKQMKEVLTTRTRGRLCRQELDSGKTSGRKGIIKKPEELLDGRGADSLIVEVFNSSAQKKIRDTGARSPSSAL
jgi:hypothetical protein